jgi:hypothetical protein
MVLWADSGFIRLSHIFAFITPDMIPATAHSSTSKDPINQDWEMYF